MRKGKLINKLTDIQSRIEDIAETNLERVVRKLSEINEDLGEIINNLEEDKEIDEDSTTEGEA